MSSYTELIERLLDVPCYVEDDAKVVAAAADAIEELQRENAELRKDAERYRWLRNNWFTMSSNYQRCITFKTGEPRWSEITETELDAAIDAAKGASNGLT